MSRRDAHTPQVGAHRWVKSVANLFGHRFRRVRVASGRRVHVELRDVAPQDFQIYAEKIERGLAKLEGVEWVRINGHLARAVVSYRSGLIAPRHIVGLIEGIEAHLGLCEAPFSGERPEHPGDAEPVTRKFVDMAANAVSVGVGLAMKAGVFPRTRLTSNLAAVLTVIDNTPRYREVLDTLINPLAADVGFGALNSLAQAIGSGPISPGIDLFFEGIKLRSERARQALWEAREPALCQLQWDRRRTPVDVDPRPRELPPSIIDTYVDQAFFASIGGFVVGLADTHNLKSSTPPLFGGLPKAAHHGEDGYLAELIRVLSERGILVLSPQRLEVMDRVDTVLIDAALLFRGELLVGTVNLLGDVSRAEVEQRVHQLFDPAHPARTQKNGEWQLSPVRQPVSGVDSDDKDGTRTGATRLALSRRGKRVADVQMRPAADSGAEQLLGSARRAGLRVVLLSDDPWVGKTLRADRVMPRTSGALQAVRDLQRDGAVVALVACGPSVALAAADLAIGVCPGEDGPPWAADLLGGRELDDAAFILEACVAARQVSEQSVQLAGLGAAIATFLSLRGLRDTKPSHVMHAVNTVAVVALFNGMRHARKLADTPRPALRDPTPWHSLSIEAALARLDSGIDGLSPHEARRRCPEIPAPPTRPQLILHAIAREMANPFTPILAAAAGISAVVGSLGDAVMVTAAMGLNGAIGGVERYQAEKAVLAMENGEVRAVRVVRAGREVEVPQPELVPGDVLLLHAGDVVPADCRLLEASDLEVDESSLTGESLPVAKSAAPSWAAAIAERSSMLYQETSVVVGRARAVVVATGMDTEAHRGVLAGGQAPPDTGVEARLQSLTDTTIPVAGLSGLFLVTSGLARNQSLDRLVDVGVGMSVAAVPEGLPLLATVAQLSAARRLSEHGVLVRNPRAIEALGRVDVLCADKTGTLTEGRIELAILSDGVKAEPANLHNLCPWQADLLAGALRASPHVPPGAQKKLPHPTDRAIIHAAAEAGIRTDYGFQRWTIVDERPFEPRRGYHANLGKSDQGLRVAIKGAPEVVLPRCNRRRAAQGTCPMSEADRQKLVACAEALAGRGLRVLAVAERVDDDASDLDDERVKDFVFGGFLGFRDPVRPTSLQAVRELKRAGVRVIMITGDHPRTARRIAQDLELINGGLILTGTQVEEMADDALAEALLHCTVIARATPSHKVRIVKALQRDHKTVAMTGDGANDAAAIRLADVGIALGEGATQAARQAADIIVVDERIETIVRAVAEGRAMWRSVRDAVSILTGGNFGEIGFTLLASLLDRPPLNARQLLLVNLLTDIAPSLSLVMRKPDEDDLHHAVQSAPETELGDELDRDIRTRALTTAAGASLAWTGSRLWLGGLGRAPTVALLSLVGTQLGQTLAINRPTRETTLASLGSAALLVGLVQTPGVSHFFGCRPLGPLGLATAATSSALATGASLMLPKVTHRTREMGAWLGEQIQYLGNTPENPAFHAPN